MLADPVTQELTVAKRLMAGACAGMTASALTHPLDTARLRLALPNHPYKGGRKEVKRGVERSGAVPNHPYKG